MFIMEDTVSKADMVNMFDNEDMVDRVDRVDMFPRVDMVDMIEIKRDHKKTSLWKLYPLYLSM